MTEVEPRINRIWVGQSRVGRVFNRFVADHEDDPSDQEDRRTEQSPP